MEIYYLWNFILIYYFFSIGILQMNAAEMFPLEQIRKKGR